MDQSMKQMTKTAMMAAIIFVCTYTFKVPVPLTGGYTHLGDCAIFIGVMILGKKQGTLAAAIGAAMADLLGGFMVWVIPTFLIKGAMALVMGTVVEKFSGKSWNWAAGAVLGGICQIICYTLVKVVMISPSAAVATIPTITSQTAAGLVIAAVVISLLRASHVMNRLKQM